MSYFGGGGAEDDEELEMDANLLLPLPNDILIDIPTTTSAGNISFVSDYPRIASEPDPLEDPFLGLEDAGGAVSSEPPPLPPEQKILVQYQDPFLWEAEMADTMEKTIDESIQLFKKDPREYHPFYLRIFKYLTFGRQQGHVPPGDQGKLKIWRKYDTLAAERWEKEKGNPSEFQGEKSPYATYILTRKVYVNGKLLMEKRNEKERNKKFNELEKVARRILRERKVDSGSIRDNLELRLKFFEECVTMTYPGDCMRMNNLWGKFCSDFGKEKIPVAGQVQLSVTPTPGQNKKKVTLKVQVTTPDDNDLAMSFSPPPSPLGEVEEVEEKYVPPPPPAPEEEAIVASASSSSPPKKIVKKMIKRKASSGPSSEDKAPENPKKKLKTNLISANSKKILKIKQGNRMGSSGISKAKFKKGKVTPFRMSIARKRVKAELKKVTSGPVDQDKILLVLEKKISVITKKLRSSRLLKLNSAPAVPSGSKAVAPMPSPLESLKTENSEFSMCEECGQTYRTSYLHIHKEAVHNPENIGKRCPLCPLFFKGGHYLWAHFLGTHMPDNGNIVNPSKAAMEVEPVVEHPKDRKPDPSRFKSSDPEEEDSWDCMHCEKQFASKASLQRHLHLVHGEGGLPENKLVCPHCSKTFKEKAALTMHIKNLHQGLENRCEICSKKFQTSGKLWKHKVDQHGIVDEAPRLGSVQCEHCGESCVQGKQYVNHVKKQHPEHLEETLRQEKVRRRERRLETKRRSNQKLQQKVKTGEVTRAPKECPECGKVLKGDLGRHMARAHNLGDTEVKIFHCPKENCPRKYRSRESLRVHLSLCHEPVTEKINEKKLIKILNPGNNKERRFMCTMCGWKTGNRYECLVHLVAAHSHFLEEDVGLSTLVKCPYCEETGRSQDLIRHHVEMLHPESVWRCPHPGCSKVILSPVDLQEHFYQEHEQRTEENGGDGGAGGIKRRRRRINRKKNRKLIGDGHGFRRGKGKYPCFRCDGVWSIPSELDSHVKEVHEEAYWPCEECGVMCFSERSKYFHQSILCRVKRQKIERNGVVGYDQIKMKCPLCPTKMMRAFGLTRHLKTSHGVIEDGDLWRCDICAEENAREKFQTREYWLAHMDDCHGGEVDMEEYIEVARKINTMEEIDLEKTKKKKGKGSTKKVEAGRKKGGVAKSGRSRAGRVIKRKKTYSSEEEEEDDEIEMKLDSDGDNGTEEEEYVPRTTSSRRKAGVSQGSKKTKELDVKEIIAKLPLKVRKMLRRECSVRLERLTEGQIEIYTRRS